MKIGGKVDLVDRENLVIPVYQVDLGNLGILLYQVALDNLGILGILPNLEAGFEPGSN